MKKITLFIVYCLLISVSVNAQISKDSLLKIMARETCEEIGKKDLSNKTMEELQVELGFAMIPVVTKYQDELQTVLGVNLEDQQGLENMGRLVGMQLAKDCPAFLKIFASNPGIVREINSRSEKEPTSSSVSGTLIKIVPGDFSYIQVKDAAGKIDKIWWMEYFEGSDKLTTNAQNYLNKPVKVNYTEKEMYNSTLKEYVKVKIITGIE